MNPNYALGIICPKGQTKQGLSDCGRSVISRQKLRFVWTVRRAVTSGRFSQSVIACASSPDKNFRNLKFFVPAWIRIMQ
ncbi:MAG: hypothetical protein ACJAVY_001401 [Marinoscillum sp.]|jgi:hypothetical protein